ncbi:MAG: head completion protein [Proteobacteria bacterium]|nr:head completion protein [Pseudomonadota bacterium]
MQGVFTAQNAQKYKGSFPIIYRSSLELKVMRWFDSNPNIITWGSESVVIPYVSPLDGRMHRYFVDFVAVLKEANGNIKKLILEIKPYKQTIKPEATKNKKVKTMIYEQTEWVRNQAKWQAAEAWAKSKGYEFIILTEKHINN